MVTLRYVTICCVFAAITAASKRPWLSEKKFEIEIISKNSTSIQARFRQLRQVRKYSVSVSVKYLADARSPYAETLKRKRDRASDGYYYIDTGPVLNAGTLHELSVYRLRRRRLIKTVDVFTDCDEYTYSCEAIHGAACLSFTQLCDDFADCLDNSDEEKINSTCAVKLLQRPTPPPPPSDTPCMMALAAVLENSGSNGSYVRYIDRPYCGKDGHYEQMKCDSLSNCHCIHPLTGEILKTQTDYHPFVNWDFSDICRKKSQQILTDAIKGEDEPLSDAGFEEPPPPPLAA